MRAKRAGSGLIGDASAKRPTRPRTLGMVQGATRHFEENQQKAATLCVSNSVFYFISDRFNVSAKLRSGVMRVSNVPPASSITRGWRFNRFRIDSDRFRNVQSLCAGYSPYKPRKRVNFHANMR